MFKREYIGKAWRDAGTISQSPPDWALRFAESIRNAVLEEAARVCECADKSTHPAELADAIRALKTKEGE